MLSMAEILDSVPGANVRERARTIGVSRQTVYSWLKGVSRPAPMQARRIALLTGYSVDDVTGPSSRYDRYKLRPGDAAKPTRA